MYSTAIYNAGPRENYTRTLGLRLIGDSGLTPPEQIFPIDSSVNLPCDNDFLY